MLDYCTDNNLPGTKNITTNTKAGILIDENMISAYVNEIENFHTNYLNQDFEYSRKVINKLYSVDAISEQLKEIYYGLY